MNEEANVLRKNLAKFLVPMYKDDPYKIGKLCDEELDRTGILLGYVRDIVINEKIEEQKLRR